jgi:hypothetical protein
VRKAASKKVYQSGHAQNCPQVVGGIFFRHIANYILPAKYPDTFKR